MHRFQISTFGSVAIVFAVIGVNQGIYSGVGPLSAMSAGWLILAIVDILWVLYFTSEEDSLALHVFNSMGTGGLTPPSRRRTRKTQSSVHNMASNNGYATNYSSGGGIGSGDIPYDTKLGGSIGGGIHNGGGVRSQNSFGGASMDGGLGNRSIGGQTGGAGSVHNSPIGPAPGSIAGPDNGPGSPLMAGVGAGGSVTSGDPTLQPETYSYRAKALYACEFYLYSVKQQF